MGKAHIIQSTFTGGEITPALKGRVDVARYKNGAETIKNAIVLTLGGVRRRPGLRLVDDEGTGKTVRLIPFMIYRSDLGTAQGYIIEFRNENTLHFYTNGANIKSGGVPVSIASPFAGANLKKIRYAQTKNTLYLIHPDFPPQQLVRTSDTSWTISAVALTEPKPLDTENDQRISGITRAGATATCTALAAHGFVTGQRVSIWGADQAEYNGQFFITVSDDFTFTYTVSGAPATPATGTISVRGMIGITRSGSTATVLTPSAHGLTTGQMVNITGAAQSEYNGNTLITRIDDTSFTYTVSGTPATPATGTISVRRIYWNSTIGYPSAITFFEQRMLLGGSKNHPATVWGSRIGDVTNFEKGTGDSDSFEFVLSGVSSNIEHLAAREEVFILTLDGELSMTGGSSDALTPSSVLISTHTPYGGKDTARPVLVGGEYLFATKNGNRLRALGYKFEKDRFTAPDLSAVAAHLLTSGIEGLASAIEPYSLIFAVTGDGKLVSVTYDPDQEVVAWAQHTTDGLFKDVATIPYNGEDQVWVAVDRVIGGATHTFLETLDSTLNTDAAITGTDGPGKATWTGLDHLNGKTVDILADGAVMPQQVVASGQVTLPRNANAVEIGLHYETEIKDLPPDLATTGGTTQGQAVSVNKAIVRLHESKGCEINGEVVPFRKFGVGILDQDVEAFTGDKEARLLGWENKGVVTIKQTQPLSFTVLAIIKEVTVNG